MHPHYHPTPILTGHVKRRKTQSFNSFWQLQVRTWGKECERILWVKREIRFDLHVSFWPHFPQTSPHHRYPSPHLWVGLPVPSHLNPTVHLSDTRPPFRHSLRAQMGHRRLECDPEGSTPLTWPCPLGYYRRGWYRKPGPELWARRPGPRSQPGGSGSRSLTWKLLEVVPEGPPSLPPPPSTRPPESTGNAPGTAEGSCRQSLSSAFFVILIATGDTLCQLYRAMQMTGVGIVITNRSLVSKSLSIPAPTPVCSALGAPPVSRLTISSCVNCRLETPHWGFPLESGWFAICVGACKELELSNPTSNDWGSSSAPGFDLE